MKFQIAIPPSLADQLRQVALQEHRPIRQQAEILLFRAIEAAAVAREAPVKNSAVEVGHAQKDA